MSTTEVFHFNECNLVIACFYLHCGHHFYSIDWSPVGSRFSFGINKGFLILIISAAQPAYPGCFSPGAAAQCSRLVHVFPRASRRGPGSRWSAAAPWRSCCGTWTARSETAVSQAFSGKAAAAAAAAGWNLFLLSRRLRGRVSYSMLML